MSRRLAFDRDADDDLRPRRQTAEATRMPDEICRHAAAVLQNVAPRSSEAQRAADDLLKLAKAISVAYRREAAATEQRRRRAEAAFRQGDDA